jgi:hypothetical protein
MLLGECLLLALFRRCKPMQQFRVLSEERTVRKTALEENKIEIPKFPRRKGRMDATIFD